MPKTCCALEKVCFFFFSNGVRSTLFYYIIFLSFCESHETHKHENMYMLKDSAVDFERHNFHFSSRPAEFQIPWDMRFRVSMFGRIWLCIGMINEGDSNMQRDNFWLLWSHQHHHRRLSLSTLSLGLLEIIFTTKSLTFFCLPFSISQVIYIRKKGAALIRCFQLVFFFYYKKGIWILFFHFHYQQVKMSSKLANIKVIKSWTFFKFINTKFPINRLPICCL